MTEIDNSSSHSNVNSSEDSDHNKQDSNGPLITGQAAQSTGENKLILFLNKLKQVLEVSVIKDLGISRFGSGVTPANLLRCRSFSSLKDD